MEWYLEYSITRNRPGLLGDITTLLGMLSINIRTINGVNDEKRAFLLECNDEEQMNRLAEVLHHMPTITVTALHPVSLFDRLAIRHGTFVEKDGMDAKVIRFTRDEIGLLIDFMAELFQSTENLLIGIRGMPRVGKTESMIAASVAANKRWILISSTLIRQTIRVDLLEEELRPNHVYMIDGVVSTMRANEEHHQVMRQVMNLPAPIVVEHPDIFVQRTEYTLKDFSYIIELRNHPDETIDYHHVKEGISSYEIS